MATADELAAEFLDRLRALRAKVGRPTYRELDKHAGLRGEKLPSSTLSDLLNGRRRPQFSTVMTFVRACARHANHAGLPTELFDPARWQAEYDRCWNHANAPVKPQPALLVWPVEDFTPSAAGIHRAVSSADGASRAELPTYVAREHDVELRERLAAAAAEGGGVILVTGASCARKTRSVWEAVRTDAFSGWQVVRPRDADQLRGLANSTALRARTVVWLDELQRYLPEQPQHGLAKEDLQALWQQHTPVVVVGTMWPDVYDQILNRGSDETAGSVLKLAGGPVQVPDRLSDAELERLRRLAADDPYLAEASADRDYGLTQVLAGAPWLVQRWAQPRFSYTRCVLAAAAAARRLGVHLPLPATLLREAARGYFPDRRPAPREWFRQALAEAEKPIRDAVSALVPERDPDDDEQAIGYTLTDYLAQHLAKGAGIEPVPVEAWQALNTRHRSGRDLRPGTARTQSRAVLLGRTPVPPGACRWT
ncbi:helix-turn-helix domain-containing protein [Labedaea rhizosphaerae]|uniref:helix-turn-helix domain-containing protein n=1 Tax=Labedaea rhizosphaerae TaxID=598644 RepID=UPI00105E6301|nr:helix-turn-helix transcriptional regulator [Labedaea rhizosphaerae]